MPELILYTDISPNLPLNFRAVATDVRCAPLFPWIAWGIPSHNPVWERAQQAMEHQGTSSRLLNVCLNILQSLAGKGNDLLLFGTEAHAQTHLDIFALLRSIPELTGHTIRSVINIGRQDITFEQRCRTDANQMPPQTEITRFLGGLTNIDTLLRLYIHELGKDSVIVLRDDWTSPLPHTTVSPALQNALELEGENVPQQPHVLHLVTRQARHIWRLCTDIRNAWPECSPQIVFDTLIQCERDNCWDTSFTTSPIVREKIRTESVQGNAWVASEFFQTETLFSPLCPDDIAWIPYTGIDDATLESFAAALPKDAAKNLVRRTEVNRRLLTPDQQRLASSLKKHIAPCVTITNAPATLAVITLAYNQEKYIHKCIDSVLAQKTLFPFKHIVLDHASSDNTPKIIAEYVAKDGRVVPILLPDRRGGENVRTLFSVADTEYVALCDGDDYFTDPYKLQKQVDFLEEHPDYALCFHPVHVVYEDGTNRERFYPPLNELPRGVREFYYLADLLKRNLIQTNSVMYRWRFRDGLPDWFRSDLVPGDWYWHLLHAEKGKIGFINEVMAVYRRHKSSLYYTTENFDTLIQHRLIHGMKELETYEVANNHFERKYDRVFCGLANAVFSAFLKHQLDTDDESYLKEAAEKFPILGLKFLKELKLYRVSR